VLAICAVQAVTVTLPATEVGIGAIAVWCVLSPVRALIGFRTLVPELRFAAPWIVRLLVASALLYIVWMGLLFVPTLLITSSIRAGSSPSVWYALIPFVMFAGIGLSIWLGTKLSLAPTITVYEERALGRSIGRSWHLTTGSFRQTFVFNLAIVLFVGILYELPLRIGSYASLALVHDPAWKNFVDKAVVIALAPVAVYGSVASYIAYARFLEMLESRAEGRLNNATNAPSPAA